MTKRVAIAGYGAVGRALAARLTARGVDVVAGQRSAPSSGPAGVRFQSTDLMDAAATHALAEGASEVVCAAGVPYRAALWERAWPRIIVNLLTACEASGARFVFADNLYMYGPQDGVLHEDTPLTAFGGKPKVRAAITRLWMMAHEAGRVRAVSVRASDFYGPDVETSVISTLGVRRLLAGQAALCPYPADHPHDFTYVPDFARALETLIDAPDDAYGRAWHVPNAPTKSLRAVLTLAAERIGVRPRITVLPEALGPVLALFSPELRELREMRFQWDRPYRVDASAFVQRFWGDTTPWEAGLDATIAFYRAQAGAGGGGR